MVKASQVSPGERLHADKRTRQVIVEALQTKTRWSARQKVTVS